MINLNNSDQIESHLNYVVRELVIKHGPFNYNRYTEPVIFSIEIEQPGLEITAYTYVDPLTDWLKVVIGNMKDLQELKQYITDDWNKDLVHVYVFTGDNTKHEELVVAKYP